MDKEYIIYHIPGKKIGVTTDLYNRVTEQQGYEEGEYEVLEKSNDIDYISLLERKLQKKYGYKNDVWINYFGNSFNIRGWELPEKKSVSNNYRFGHDYVFSTLELRKLIIKDNIRSGLSKGCLLYTSPSPRD